MSKKRNEKNKEKVPPELQARRETYDWIQCIITALIICVVVFSFFIRCPSRFQTGSWNCFL